jgi:Ca-activated chloride channel homolog
VCKFAYNPAVWQTFKCATAFLLASFALLSQQVSIEPRPHPSTKTQPDERKAHLKIDTSLVLVPFTVTDRLGRPVLGLETKDFRIFDNKVEQRIVNLAMEDDPVAVGFIFDVSGSIGGAMGRYRMAAREFFKVADEKDEFFLVEFESAPKLAVPLSRDAANIDYQIMMTKSKGMTALFDAVYLATNEIRKSQLVKKALILISDGGENHSRYTLPELQNALRETDALLYAIGPRPDDVHGDNDGRLLKHLAELTGGRLIELGGVGLAELAQKVIIDLRNRYLISYSPTENARDGKYHAIQLQLIPPEGMGKLTVHWRTGYYAPTQ